MYVAVTRSTIAKRILEARAKFDPSRHAMTCVYYNPETGDVRAWNIKRITAPTPHPWHFVADATAYGNRKDSKHSGHYAYIANACRAEIVCAETIAEIEPVKIVREKLLSGDAYDTPGDEYVRHAVTKPANTSDARWRMEQHRRSLDSLGRSALPDPEHEIPRKA